MAYLKYTLIGMIIQVYLDVVLEAFVSISDRSVPVEIKDRWN